jgi:aryl-alcohol dehydrogenase-like predicted oxidoreductase
MRYQKLGRSGLNVSSLCLGTMSFGRWIDEEASISIINTALDRGINFIDTANFYGKGQDTTSPYGTGESEEILGRALKGRRDKVVLATKVGLPMIEGKKEIDLSRVEIMKEVDRSLQRLKTDYIDLYQVHRFDQHTPLEETVCTLNDLVRQGKVRYIGCSNFAAWQIAKSCGISEKMNAENFISIQSPYNLLDREIEREVLSFCQSEDVGLMVYSPMARGLLSGKYKGPNDTPPESRAAHGEAKLKELFSDRNFLLVEQFHTLAKQNETSLSQLALAWVLNQPLVTSAIIGASKVHHVTDALEISDWTWSEKLLSEANQIFYMEN